MTLASLIVRNARRNRVRAIMTVAAMAITIVAFVILRASVAAYRVYTDQASRDRLVITHRVAGDLEFPVRYSELVRNVPGVSAVSYGTGIEAHNPKHPAEEVSAIAVHADTFFAVFDEVVVPADQRDQWIANRSGAVVGRRLAEKQGISVGDALSLSSDGINLSLKVEGIYEVSRPGFPRNLVLLHYERLNQIKPPEARDRIARISARVESPDRTDEVAQAVARALENQSEPTLTESELVQRRAFLGAYSSILAAIDIASVAMLAIMLLIVANTIAMGVRERTGEYAVMRALGFQRRHVLVAVLGEGLALGTAAGILGVALAEPIVNVWLARWLQQNAGDLVEHWHADAATMGIAAVLVLAAAAAAAIIPAWQASRQPVREVLRHLG